MSTLSKLPAHYDIGYILGRMEAVGITNHYGHGLNVDGTIWLRYLAEDFDAVQLILNSYQVDYANEKLRPKMLEDTASIRWDKQQMTTFNGSPLPCDMTTINLIDATRNSMIDAPTSPQSCLWKTGPTTWATLDAPALLNMGLAIRNHVQLCFEREKALQDAILIATTADELIAIDITSGWPS